MGLKRKYSYETIQLTMSDWQQAYRAANNKPAPGIHYEDGWFIISHTHFPPSRHRRSDILKFTQTLLKRIERSKQSEADLRNGSSHQGPEPGQPVG